MHPELTSRFLRYVQIDTTSDEDSPTAPSTAKQLDLLRLLQQELAEIGAEDIWLTKHGVLYATIPATAGYEHIPTVAFLAHVDTSPAFSGTAVKPIVHENYDGSPIVLPDNPSLIIDPAQYPYLAQKVGEDVITASGTTLLGADDKAGVAIVMTLAEVLLHGSSGPHGRVRLCFTPDEEIGRGVVNVRLADLDAAVGYTLDGGALGEVEWESFSADKAVVRLTGVSTHPGYAKDELVNALYLAGQLLTRVAEGALPETTSGRVGFTHAYELTGTAAEAEVRFILRAFEMDELESHGRTLRRICDELQAAEPRAHIELAITPQYRNMRYWLEKDKTPVELALEAVRQLGAEPIQRAIRGGTDGSRLTEMGLPTPNLFTGMQNFHGPLEWVSVQDMEKGVQVCVNLLGLWAGR
ncbi:MAG: peptidase T [Chloroflexi bacterium]|nr:peptidase T [Chloroflexota bacterium]